MNSQIGGADDRGGDDVVEVVHLLLDLTPVLAELVAQVGEAEHPDEGARGGVEREATQRHARGAGRERDEGADDRQQARDEHRDAAVLVEVLLGRAIILGSTCSHLCFSAPRSGRSSRWRNRSTSP